MDVMYLWDTNIVVYYLQQQLPSEGEKFIDEILKSHPPAVSFITEMELLCWKFAKDEDMAVVQNFVSDAVVFDMDASIKASAVRIRKSTGVKLPDAIIAATAAVHKLTLLTRNIRDFEKEEGLRVLNPFSFS